MPRELPTHFSPRCSDTGQNLGYHCDPLLKEKVIAFSFFKICPPPWSKCEKKFKKLLLLPSLTPYNDPSFTLQPMDWLLQMGAYLKAEVSKCVVFTFLCL